MQNAIGIVTVFALAAIGSVRAGDATGDTTGDTTEGGAMQQIRAYIQDKAIETGSANWRTRLPEFPDVDFAGDEAYTWRLKTNKGEIDVTLLADAAPRHVANFLYLTELGFFDGLTFHRVIPGFMAQGGCPLGTGTGSPGYGFDGEFGSGLKHDAPGMLSMANAGPGTDGSQFFLTFVPTPWLDGKHTIFGRVTKGQDTLKALEACGSSPMGRTTEKLVIESASIVTH
jgi:peptidyl-prolyl cis-trans isomerase B (cyclophilin B)